MPVKPWDPFPDINMLQACMGVVEGSRLRGGDWGGWCVYLQPFCACCLLPSCLFRIAGGNSAVNIILWKPADHQNWSTYPSVRNSCVFLAHKISPTKKKVLKKSKNKWLWMFSVVRSEKRKKGENCQIHITWISSCSQKYRKMIKDWYFVSGL
jgi:hypothetical protein